MKRFYVFVFLLFAASACIFSDDNDLFSSSVTCGDGDISLVYFVVSNFGDIDQNGYGMPGCNDGCTPGYPIGVQTYLNDSLTSTLDTEFGFNGMKRDIYIQNGGDIYIYGAWTEVAPPLGANIPELTAEVRFYKDFQLTEELPQLRTGIYPADSSLVGEGQRQIWKLDICACFEGCQD